MRFLYIYNPLTKTVIEKKDVSHLPSRDVERFKINLLLAMKFPLELRDSDEGRAPNC